jgi:hypothetical protein
MRLKVYVEDVIGGSGKALAIELVGNVDTPLTKLYLDTFADAAEGDGTTLAEAQEFVDAVNDQIRDLEANRR